MERSNEIRLKLDQRDIIQLLAMKNERLVDSNKLLDAKFKAMAGKYQDANDQKRKAVHDLNNQKQIVLFQKDQIKKLKLNRVQDPSGDYSLTTKDDYYQGREKAYLELLRMCLPYVESLSTQFMDAEDLANTVKQALGGGCEH